MNLKDYPEKNIHEMTNRELSTFITSLQNARRAKNDVPSISVNEIMALLHIAASEQSSRASSRLAKLALFISVVGVGVALFSIYFSINKQ